MKKHALIAIPIITLTLALLTSIAPSALAASCQKNASYPITIDRVIVPDWKEFYEFHLFPTKNDCIAGQNRLVRSTLDKRDLRGYRTKPTSFAKLVMEGKARTKCVQPRLTEDCQAAFSFRSHSFGKRRDVVVISNSSEFETVGGFRLLGVVHDWLIDAKKKMLALPLDVVLLKSDGRVVNMIRAEDLYDAPARRTDGRGARSIEQRLAAITLNDHGYQPAANLRHVDIKYGGSLRNRLIRRVLYITERQAPEELFSADDVATALSWAHPWKGKTKIPLTVVTIGDCEVWHDAVYAKKCTSLSKGDSNQTLRKALDAFAGLK